MYERTRGPVLDGLTDQSDEVVLEHARSVEVSNEEESAMCGGESSSPKRQDFRMPTFSPATITNTFAPLRWKAEEGNCMPEWWAVS